MDDIRSVAKRFSLALCSIDKTYYLTEKKKRLSDAELCIMYALDDGEPHSQKEIAEEWLIPRTTINTITKHWESDGLLVQRPIPGRRREMQLTLTEAGKAYAKSFLSFLYEAEEHALQKTIDRYSDAFIEALEYFGERLKEAFEEQASAGEQCAEENGQP